MKQPTVALFVFLISLVGRPSWGTEREIWFSGVFQAAQCLTGVWKVEGTLGGERWTGKWTCHWLAKPGAYYMSCSGGPADRPESVKHVSVVKAWDAGTGQLIEHRYPAPKPDPKRSRSLHTFSAEPRATGHPAESPGPLSQGQVTRKGTGEIEWQALTAEGNRLTLTFHRLDASPKRM